MGANAGHPANKARTPTQILAQMLAVDYTPADNKFGITGSSDTSKVARFEVDGFTTATTRTFTLPNASTTVAGLSVAQTFSALQTFGGALATAVNSGSTINGDFSDTAPSRSVAVLRVNTSATAHTAAALLDVISGASTVSDIMFRLRASSVDLVKAYADGAVSVSVGPLIVGAASVASGTASLYVKQVSNSASAYGARFVHASSDGDYFQMAYDVGSALGLGTNGLAVYSTQISTYAFTIERSGRVGSFSSLVCGTNAAIATNATDGFLYLPTCAGTPTGVPTAITGKAPACVDSTNNFLYLYIGGAWKKSTVYA